MDNNVGKCSAVNCTAPIPPPINPPKKKKIILCFFLYRCVYPHRSRDSLSPVCGIFISICNFFHYYLALLNTTQWWFRWQKMAADWLWGGLVHPDLLTWAYLKWHKSYSLRWFNPCVTIMWPIPHCNPILSQHYWSKGKAPYTLSQGCGKNWFGRFRGIKHPVVHDQQRQCAPPSYIGTTNIQYILRRTV